MLDNYPDMSHLIPIIETRGTHFEVGQQIGIAARTSLQSMYAETLAEYGDRWTSLLQQSGQFLSRTERHLPKVVAELRGCARGATIPFEDLFLMSIEELLYEEVRGGSPPLSMSHSTQVSSNQFAPCPPSPPATRAGAEGHSAGGASRIDRDERRPAERAKGCSDLAAAPPATSDGHVWLAHNNDLGPGSLNQLFVTKFRVDGEPEILAVTVGGIFISIGLNIAGISLTGNQLNSNDSRAGVPRLLIVRDILAQTTMDDALSSALLPERASSYNNIIASRDGRIVNVEGSATAAALSWSQEGGGTVAHTNHYLSPDMLHFEADGRNIAISATRCSRAFDYAVKYRGRINFDICARFVRDHVYAPWSVCKHAGQSVTVFSALIDLSEFKLWLTRGNPCLSDFVLYTFSNES